MIICIILPWRENLILIILEKKLKDKIIEIKVTSDGLVLMKLVTEDCVWNMISALYTAVGCATAEKAGLYQGLDQMVTRLSDKEDFIIGAYLNSHIEDQRDGFESEHDGNGYGQRND